MMDLRTISEEIHSHAIKMESMTKQITKSNLEIYNLTKENEKLKDIICKVKEEDYVSWIEEKIERYEKAINKSFLQIDLVNSGESDADIALNYIFKYFKEALKIKL